MRIVRWLTLLAFLYVAPAAFPQQPTAPPGVKTPGGNAPQSAQAPAKKKNEHKISEKEAKELFAQVDEILKFVSKDTGLEIKHPVKRQLTSREEVRKYVTEKSRSDEDVKKLARTGVVLKKLGLLPRDFDLDKYLSDLLEEQVAGYYDSKTKTVYLLDWIDADSQKPVLAHELTHALQDQNYDLEKFLRKGVKEEDQSKSLKSHEEIEVHVEEPGTARQAIIEGQAMVVLIDYMLAPTGHTIADSPMIGQMIKMNAAHQNDDYPLMAKAPVYLRDALMFPYTYGMDFTAAMLRTGGTRLAFAGVLANPPRNTREVMEPKAYGTGEQLESLLLPDMHKLLGKEYEPYDIGNVGEFDVHSLLTQYAGMKTADKLSPSWRGGAYYAAERVTGMAGKTDCAAKPADAKLLDAQRVACLAMLVETRWDSPDAAGQFAERYASMVSLKYKSARNLADVNTPPQKSDKARPRCFTCVAGERFQTEDGLVTIQQQGNRVLALETFDDATTPKLQQAALPQTSPR